MGDHLRTQGKPEYPMLETMSKAAEADLSSFGVEPLENDLAVARRKRLAAIPMPLELRCSKPRPAVPRNRGRSLSFIVDADTTSGLRRLHRSEGCTMFMALLTGFATMLHRRTRATDVLIGTDMANRIPSGAETLIGMFINQVVLRLDLDGAPDFLELLRRARLVTGEAYTHQTVPFEELVDHILPRRDPSRPSLVQVKLVLENTDSGRDRRPEDAGGDDPSRRARFLPRRRQWKGPSLPQPDRPAAAGHGADPRRARIRGHPRLPEAAPRASSSGGAESQNHDPLDRQCRRTTVWNAEVDRQPGRPRLSARPRQPPLGS